MVEQPDICSSRLFSVAWEKKGRALEITSGVGYINHRCSADIASSSGPFQAFQCEKWEAWNIKKWKWAWGPEDTADRALSKGGIKLRPKPSSFLPESLTYQVDDAEYMKIIIIALGRCRYKICRFGRFSLQDAFNFHTSHRRGHFPLPVAVCTAL